MEKTKGGGKEEGRGIGGGKRIVFSNCHIRFRKATTGRKERKE